MSEKRDKQPRWMSETIDKHLKWIPEGYTVLVGPDDYHYVVPQSFLPSLHHNLDSYEKKKEMEIGKHAGVVSVLNRQ